MASATDPKQFRHRAKVHMRWSDMDELAHINNAVFLTYLEEGRIEYLESACKWNWREEGMIVARIEIDYMRPLLYLHPAFIYTRCSRLGTKSFDLEYLIVSEIEGKEIPVAAAKTIMVSYDFKTKLPTAVSTPTRAKFVAYEGESILTEKSTS